tara:strand:- start:537 stop:1673 length:1137 start_codon:yes stop_codon:yes gene_type:complete
MDPLLIVIILLVLVIAGLIFKLSQDQHGSPVSAEDVATKLEPKMLELLSKAMKNNNDEFTELAGTKTENLLNPFKNQIKNLDTAVKDLKASHESEKGTVKTLGEQIMDLASSNRSVTESLRSSTSRGLWGEHQLRNVIRLAGMERHITYDEQKVGQNLEQELEGEGSGKPDFVLSLPNGSSLAIDSKAPTELWIEAQENKDLPEAEKEVIQKNYSKKIRGHITKLSEKKYWEHYDGSNPELVVMFLPAESLLSDALILDAGLFTYASEKNVALATPISLLAMLWAVAKGWQEFQFSERADEIVIEAKRLNSNVKNFVQRFGETGEKLEKAVNQYNSTLTGYKTMRTTLDKFESFEIWNEEIPDPNSIEVLVDPIPDKE